MSRRVDDNILFRFDPFYPTPEVPFVSSHSSRESNDVTSDYELARRLQQEYDEEDGSGETFQEFTLIQDPPSRQEISTNANEDTINDELIARQLHENLNGSDNDSNIRSIDISSLEDINVTPRLRQYDEEVDRILNFDNLIIPSSPPSPPPTAGDGRMAIQLQQSFDDEVIYFEDGLTGNIEGSNGVGRKDLGSIIRKFHTKLHHKHPEARLLHIQLSSRNPDIMFAEFIDAIKQFRETDFILKPKISFRNEPALDAGGVFNDTIHQILEMFMSLENPEYGGDGHLFTGDSSKLISSTAPVHIMDELDAFGDVLFLAVIHNAPFPYDLDISLFNYCLNLESSITLDDLKGFSMPMYNLARKVFTSAPNVDLSTIEGFDQWAEEKEINAIQRQMYSRSRDNIKKLAKLICEDVLINSRINQLKAIYKKFNKFGFFDVLRSKQVGIKEIKNYFYREIINPNDIIKKLVFDGHLNHKQMRIRGWLIDWLGMQGKEKLQEFCRLITGFKNPREELKVSFKPYVYDEPRELQLTPKFATCTREMRLSDSFSSRQEFYNSMNAQVDQTIHDNRFTTA